MRDYFLVTRHGVKRVGDLTEAELDDTLLALAQDDLETSAGLERAALADRLQLEVDLRAFGLHARSHDVPLIY